MKIQIKPNANTDPETHPEVPKKTDYDDAGGETPHWDQSLTWQCHAAFSQLSMSVAVWDHESIGRDDFIGAGMVATGDLRKGIPAKRWVKLTEKGQLAGEVLIEVTLSPPFLM